MTVTKSKVVAKNSSPTWEVSAEGFDTQSGTVSDIAQDETLNVYLLGSLIGRDIKKVKNQGYSTMCLTTNNELYAVGNFFNTTTFSKIADNIKDFDASVSTFGYITNDNILFMAGSNSDGQQGSGDTTNVTTFTQRLTDVDKVICGEHTTWALKTDGTLWGCGANTAGNQGNGSSGNNVTTFTQRLTDVKDFDADWWVTWAVKTDGTLWGCGWSNYGQQGNGTASTSSKVTSFTQRLTDVDKVFCSNYTTWAIKTDGTLWGCGSGSNGAQGSGDTTNVTTFTSRVSNVADVKCTGTITWALTKSGNLLGCGYAYSGQQGSGNTTDVTTFTQRLTDVAKFSASSGTTWAVKTDGTLWGTGSNDTGQQSNGTSGTGEKVTTFTQRLTGVKDVDAGDGATWAIKTDGTLWGCGANGSGQQGSGDTTNVTTFTQRELKSYNSANFTITPTPSDATVLIDNVATASADIRKGLTASYSVSASGYATTSGTTDRLYADLTLPVALGKVRQMIVSSDDSWILDTDGTLWGTGWNEYGQQGSGNTSNVTTFTQRLTDVAKFYIGSWALKTDGTLWGCGYNAAGQQGSGGTSNVTTFTQRLTDVKEVINDAARTVTWALKTDGTLWGCGNNERGQQGSGNTTNVTTFTQRLTDVEKVVADYKTTWAIKTDGTLWGCGANDYGQQGSGTSSPGTNVTTFIQRLTEVKDVFVSQNPNNNVTWALKTDGTLWGCGYNAVGQQGSGGTSNVTTFTQRLTDVAKVYIGSYFIYALKTDGTLWGCGSNDKGQQGSGDTTNVTTFTQRLTDVADILPTIFKSSTPSCMIALKKDGTLWGCGDTSKGIIPSGNNKVFTQLATNVKDFKYESDCLWVLKNDGTLWGCGQRAKGRQGDGYTYAQDSYVTTLTQRQTDVSRFILGYNIWAIKTNEDIYRTGVNTYGQLGTGGTSNLTTFTKLSFRE